MGLFDGTVQSLSEQALDAAWYKQQVISNNISNASTPDFKAKTVEFGIILEEKCRCKYHTSDDKEERKPKVTVATTVETNTDLLLNVNNVDMEKEALDLADVQYQYSALLDHMNSNYSMIRAAISK